MNDFIADLETELVSAARRRSEGHRRLPRPRFAALAAAAAILLVALAAVAAVRGIDTSRTGDERPAPPPPSSGPGVTVTLPAAVDAKTASGCAQPVGGYDLSGVTLSVFDRAQAAGDRLPGNLSWLPASMYAPGSVRQVGPGLHLVMAGVTERPCADRHVFQSGACVIVGRAAGRCFTSAEIASGSAVTVFRGTAYGIAPDGVESVELSWNGGRAAATVRDNAYAVDGVPANGRVHIEPSGAVAGCVPSAAAYGAAPALRLQAARKPPRSLAAAMQQLGSDGDWLAHARHLTTRTGVEIWVVPDMPCDRADPRPERVCLLAVADGRAAPLLCATPADIRQHGAWLESGPVSAGFAPADARWAEAKPADSRNVTLMHVDHGVFGSPVSGTDFSMRFR